MDLGRYLLQSWWKSFPDSSQEQGQHRKEKTVFPLAEQNHFGVAHGASVTLMATHHRSNGNQLSSHSRRPVSAQECVQIHVTSSPSLSVHLPVVSDQMGRC